MQWRHISSKEDGSPKNPNKPATPPKRTSSFRKLSIPRSPRVKVVNKKVKKIRRGRRRRYRKANNVNKSDTWSVY